MVGQNVGKYRVLERVGRGGMGTVYRAIDETLHREVAIKVLNAELNDPEVARRFRAEAITVARLNHPGIATIYELFQHDGQWLMVMEFVRGETLEHLIDRTGPQAADRAAELCMQSLVALSHAHSMGVVHRDLKPANIMVTETGAIKIMDFGIARVAGTEHLTNAGFMMGTPAYMAPEQVLGHEIDARADLYAMGVVFYRLVTAQLPFKGETPFAMAQAQVNTPPTPIAAIRQDLPFWVDEVMTRSLAKKPDDRFQSAAEFHENLVRSMSPPLPGALPSGAILTPSKPVPTGSIDRATPSGTTARSGTHVTPVVVTGGTSSAGTGAAPVSDDSGIAPTIAAATPAVLQRPPTESLTVSATSGLAVTPSNVAVERAASGAVAERPLVSEQPPAAVHGEAPERRGISPAIIGAAAAAIIVIGAGAFFLLRPSPEPAPAAVAPAAAAPETTSPIEPPPPTPTPAAPPPPPSVAPPVTPAPAVADAAATAGPDAAAPDRGATGVGASGRGTDPTNTASAARGAAPARGAGGPASAARGVAPIDDSLLAVTDVRAMVVTGNKARDEEALLNFGSGQIAVVDRRSGTVVKAIPYGTLASATYVRARDPRWNSAYVSPPDNLDVGGLLRTSKHWLTLQTADAYLILRLEDANIIRVIQTIEARTGVTVARPTSNDRN